MRYSSLNFTYGNNFDTQMYDACVASFSFDMISSHSSMGNQNVQVSRGGCSDFFKLVTVSHEEPLTFELNIGTTLQEGWTPMQVSKIQHALTKDRKFKKLIFYDDPERESYYWNCVLSNFNVSYANGKAYEITCTGTCDSPYAYALYDAEYIFKGTGTYVINCDCTVDRPFSPYMRITMGVNGGNVTIKNERTGNTLTFENLASNEIVEITENKRIISSYSIVGREVFRIENCNCDFITIDEGYNNIVVSGDVDKVEINHKRFYKLGL